MFARVVLLFLAAALPVVADSSARDEARIAEIMEQGEVLESEQLGVGVSRPLKWRLRHGDSELKAVFKAIDRFEAGTVRGEFGFRQNFDDTFRYDRAAYLLDRYLGLDRVPVVVLREWKGTPGAVVEWVSDAIDEEARRERDLSPPDPRAFELERARMRLFDALIANEDRNLGNQLITTSDWKLHLIDHTRSFRLHRHVPGSFTGHPARLSRQTYDRLKEMTPKSMHALLKPLVSRARIKAMLARRDKIVAKIEADLERYGPAVVFPPDFE